MPGPEVATVEIDIKTITIEVLLDDYVDIVAELRSLRVDVARLRADAEAKRRRAFKGMKRLSAWLGCRLCSKAPCVCTRERT